MFFVGFSEDFTTNDGIKIEGKHSYYISNIIDGVIELTDSQNSDNTHTCSLQDILENVSQFAVMDMSNNTFTSRDIVFIDK